MRRLRFGLRGDRPETPKPGSPLFRRSRYRIVASNEISLRACTCEARRHGYVPRVVTAKLTGEAQSVARDLTLRFGRAVRSRGPRARPLAWLSGGETTVRLGTHSGRGGRNQEFALAAAASCKGWPEVAILSAGTDGIDGPTDAAGGCVSGLTWEEARRREIDIPKALTEHNAYPALARLGALVMTGPTGTNVMDLQVLLSRPLRSQQSVRESRSRVP
jgi:glycerate 2-kinase